MFKQPRTPRLSVRPRETCPSITKASHQHQTHVLSSSHHSSAQRHSPFLPCSYYVRSRLARDGRACNYFNDALLPAVFRYPPCLALSHITCFSFIFFFSPAFPQKNKGDSSSHGHSYSCSRSRSRIGPQKQGRPAYTCTFSRSMFPFLI